VRVDRRRFIEVSALGILAGVNHGCAATDTGATADAEHLQLQSLLGPDPVRQLGATYRASTPNENTAAALRSALSARSGFRIPFAISPSLSDRIRDDFAAGRIVVVDGWVLSITEARQAALFSLTPA
jgi:hypothetical protein